MNGMTNYPPGVPVIEEGTIEKVVKKAAEVDPWLKFAWGLVHSGGVAISVYHGTRRNDSVLWGLAWGALATVAPIVTPALAVAQGLGKPKKKRRRRRRR
jgi:hypothetical protein